MLDRESKLKRGHFREESLTDIFTASLAAFAGPSLVIQYPIEPDTGGDLDIEFHNIRAGEKARFRIQAKRLNAEVKKGRSIQPKHRSYEQLLHEVPSSGEHQFRTLVDSAGTYTPLYMFYNHKSVVQDAEFVGQRPTVCGINLAFAHDVAMKLEEHLAALPRRKFNRRLTNLRPYFFGLATIFCAQVAPGDDVPSPRAVVGALRKQWRQSSGARGEALPAPIRISRGIARCIPDGPAIRVAPEVERPTITFLSGRTEDDLTPKITVGDPFGW
jgi:hypothetical protein